MIVNFKQKIKMDYVALFFSAIKGTIFFPFNLLRFLSLFILFLIN